MTKPAATTPVTPVPPDTTTDKKEPPVLVSRQSMPWDEWLRAIGRVEAINHLRATAEAENRKGLPANAKTVHTVLIEVTVTTTEIQEQP